MIFQFPQKYYFILTVTNSEWALIFKNFHHFLKHVYSFQAFRQYVSKIIAFSVAKNFFNWIFLKIITKLFLLQLYQYFSCATAITMTVFSQNRILHSINLSIFLKRCNVTCNRISGNLKFTWTVGLSWHLTKEIRFRTSCVCFDVGKFNFLWNVDFTSELSSQW